MAKDKKGLLSEPAPKTSDDTRRLVRKYGLPEGLPYDHYTPADVADYLASDENYVEPSEPAKKKSWFGS